MFAQEIAKLLTALRNSPDYAGLIEQRDFIHQISEKARATEDYTTFINERLAWSGVLTGLPIEQKVIITFTYLIQELSKSNDEDVDDSLVSVYMPLLDDMLQEGYGERRRTS